MIATIVTTESIMGWFTEQIENKLPIDPHMWLEGAQKVNVLLQSEQELLYDMEQEVAQLRKVLLESDKTVSYAKMMIEATPEYKLCKVQKAKIERCLEFVRLAKIYSRTSQDIYKSQ